MQHFLAQPAHGMLLIRLFSFSHCTWALSGEADSGFFIQYSLCQPLFLFVVSYYAAEKINFPLREVPSYLSQNSIIFLNWLWITEVSLQVSVVAGGEDYLSAFALHVCVHVCYMIWLTTPHNPAASGHNMWETWLLWGCILYNFVLYLVYFL